MATFKEMHNQLRRIAILRFLFVTPGQTVNSDILKIVLNERGIVTSKEDLEDDLSFLSLHNLIEIKYFFEEKELHVLALTEKGEDAALGRIIVEGVRRPRKGDNLPKIPASELGVPYGSY